jgi:hypothetical protein
MQGNGGRYYLVNGEYLSVCSKTQTRLIHSCSKDLNAWSAGTEGEWKEDNSMIRKVKSGINSAETHIGESL